MGEAPLNDQMISNQSGLITFGLKQAKFQS